MASIQDFNVEIESNRPPIVLAIAGFDPSGGAGILADVKTISAFRCYGLAAITSLTFQNTERVFGVRHQSRETLRRQLAPLFDDFDITAIKTGMLPTSAIIEEVAASIRSRGVKHLVVDPVLRSSSGYDMIDEDAIGELIVQLFPLAEIVTPNSAEAERISGVQIHDDASRERAAEKLQSLGPRAVLITGGDADGDMVTDFLLDEDGPVAFTASRIHTLNTHGTGCTLSSALACLLARGYSMRNAVQVAKNYVTEAIGTGPAIGHGRRPLSDFPPNPD
ncbi:MAG TPA: bifunctional hydroxymethylpyrimidine kinase/phosphomethylpyrimidine kinase [Blastocatellia bacterium]|nr:bifunctional hydroxymethylpyrimidine kinase/phosphomethylpyrimidine kinase [Blastocatellia bacterium]